MVSGSFAVGDHLRYCTVPWLWWAEVQYTLHELGDMRMLANKEVVDPGMCR